MRALLLLVLHAGMSVTCRYVGYIPLKEHGIEGKVAFRADPPPLFTATLHGIEGMIAFRANPPSLHCYPACRCTSAAASRRASTR